MTNKNNTKFKDIFKEITSGLNGSILVTNKHTRIGLDYFVKINTEKLIYLEESPQKSTRIEINFENDDILLNNQAATSNFKLEFRKKIKQLLNDIKTNNAICRKGLRA